MKLEERFGRDGDWHEGIVDQDTIAKCKYLLVVLVVIHQRKVWAELEADLTGVVVSFHSPIVIPS